MTKNTDDATGKQLGCSFQVILTMEKMKL